MKKSAAIFERDARVPCTLHMVEDWMEVDSRDIKTAVLSPSVLLESVLKMWPESESKFT